MVKIETINENHIASFQLVSQDMSSTNKQNLILSFKTLARDLRPKKRLDFLIPLWILTRW